MPELPEVETVRRGIQPAMEGAVILRAIIRRPDLRIPFPPNFAARLVGAGVRHLRRRSKYILADLDRDETLLVHLGMSGRLSVHWPSDERATTKNGGPLDSDPDRGAPDRHDHVILHLDNGARLVFNDPRRFGLMDLFATATEETHSLLRHLGPEPLGNAFDAAGLIASVGNRNTPLKSALLDQRTVAGLGNIYVCEALYRAGISPLRKANRTSAARIATLVPAIRDVLNEALASGGSSLRDYRQADGALGYFQHRFDVYGREGAPCRTPACGAAIRRVVQAGRSSFYCPACQR